MLYNVCCWSYKLDRRAECKFKKTFKGEGPRRLDPMPVKKKAAKKAKKAKK